MVTRLAGRLVTGAAAHLVAGVIDWAALLGKVLGARLRGREVRW